MSTKEKYIEIKNTRPEMHKCFFAFGNEQFEEGKAKAGILPDEEVFHYRAGLYGTKEGLKEYVKSLAAINARIPKECDPQDVYDYEYANHECGNMGDDTEAINLVVAYFGKRAGTVMRQNGWVDIDDLFKAENNL
jgi:hypothetical protein